MKQDRCGQWWKALLLVGILMVAATGGRALDDLVSFEVSGVGESIPQAEENASRLGAKKAVAWLYFGGEALMARDLLNRYLEQYHKRFVVTQRLEERSVTEGRYEVTTRVTVDLKTMHSDLREKHFLYEPKLRPYFAIYLAENVDGGSASGAVGYRAILDTLRDRTVRSKPEVLVDPSPSADVSSSDALMSQARMVADRNEIELILTGTVNSKEVEQRELYYDKFFFVESEVTLKLIRVDTGEVLKEATQRRMASHTDRNTAIALAAGRACQGATNELIDYYVEVWPKLMLKEADYVVLLTGLGREELDLVKDLLSRDLKDVKIYERSVQEDVAVLTLAYKGSKESLAGALREITYPSLSLKKPVQNRIVAQKVP
ncbi:MAG: hypothetical protein V2A74_06020 [bacterium]